MNTEQITALAVAVLRPKLERFGLEKVEIAAGCDHDGDPALFVEAHYRQGSKVPNGSVLLDALSALRIALQKAGEERPPYLDHRFSHDENLGDEELEDQDNSPQP